MKLTRIVVLTLAASAFLATGTYAQSSQTDTIPATATISNVGSALNTLTVIWSHRSLDCGTFAPAAAVPGPVQTYAAGSPCGSAFVAGNGADATAAVTQTGASAQPFTVTATDLGASALPGFVSLLFPGAMAPHTLGINLALMIGGVGHAFGASYTPGGTVMTTNIAIAGTLAQTIGEPTPVTADTYESGVYLGSMQVIVSL